MSAEFRTTSFRMTVAEAADLVRGASVRGESVSAFIRAAVEERLRPTHRPSVTFQMGSPNATLQVCVTPTYVPSMWTVGAPTIIEWGAPAA